jgi:hypothetical protein
LFALARNRGIDVANAHVAERAVFLPESLEELSDVPSANADGRLRQAPVMAQVAAKLIDQMRIGVRRHCRLTQTTEEVEPILGIGTEADSAPPAIGRALRPLRGTNPRFRGILNRFQADVVCCSEIKLLNKYE